MKSHLNEPFIECKDTYAMKPVEAGLECIRNLPQALRVKRPGSARIGTRAAGADTAQRSQRGRPRSSKIEALQNALTVMKQEEAKAEP